MCLVPDAEVLSKDAICFSASHKLGGETEGHRSKRSRGKAPQMERGGQMPNESSQEGRGTEEAG